MTGLLRFTLVLAVALVGGSHETVQPGRPRPDRANTALDRETQTDNADTAYNHRVVHHFDFDERSEGNLEEDPKFWTQLRLDAFPHFATGGFDFEVGHAAPPSFVLRCSGRNVAYEYSGPDTPIRPSAQYRVAGFVRTEGLRGARACLSAHYLDRDGRTLAGTVVRSRYVGESSDAGRWQQVELFLPPAPRTAYTVGLIAWLLQEPTWQTTPAVRRHISRSDVDGTAWFDDVTIYALPRIDLSSGAPGNVLPAQPGQALRALVADYELVGITAYLRVYDAAGDLVLAQDVPAAPSLCPEPTRIPVDHLPPGLYRADLTVTAGASGTHPTAIADSAALATRDLTFARLGPVLNQDGRTARPFGVVIDPQDRCEPECELALMRHLLVRSAKLPFWSGGEEDSLTSYPGGTTAQADAGESLVAARDHLLQDLVKCGFSLTGVFAGPPAAIARAAGPFPPPLLELLAGDPTVWQDHLAEVVVPHADLIQRWQIGSDFEPRMPSRFRVAARSSSGRAESSAVDTALDQMYTAMSRFITVPQLALAMPATIELPVSARNVAGVTLVFPPQWSSDEFATAVAGSRAQGLGQVTAYLAPPTDHPYQRVPRLALIAQRMLLARAAGADTVYVPQPWHTASTRFGPTTEPTEEFLVVRTIADVVGAAVPLPEPPCPPGVRCLPFRYGRATTLALWDEGAPLTGRVHLLQLGQASTVIDAWGRSSPLQRAPDGRHVVSLSPLPVYVSGVENWLVDLQASFRVTPAWVQTGTELAHHTLELRYPGDEAVSGTVRLGVSPDWETSPREMRFHASPQNDEQWAFEVRYPHSAAAGKHTLLALVDLDSHGYHMELPLTIELGLPDVDVWGEASLRGRDLVLTHGVTNRSAGNLHFRSGATVPARERQYHPLANVRPGDTQTVEYRFANAAGLRGSTVRLMLRELADGPRIHTLELKVP